jgi:hypothetical protein
MMETNERESLLWACKENAKAQEIIRKSTHLVMESILSGKGKPPRQLALPTSFDCFGSRLIRAFWEENDFKVVHEVLQDGDTTWLLGEYKNHTSPYLFTQRTETLKWKQEIE